MTRLIRIAFAAAVLALGGCDAGGGTADSSPPIETATKESATAEPTPVETAPIEAMPVETALVETGPTPAPSAEQPMAIVITGFECGDNCYLDYRLRAEPDGESQSALCSVGECGLWFEEQQMPPDFEGRMANVMIGKGKQYDGSGTVMSDDFPEIKSITIEPAP